MSSTTEVVMLSTDTINAWKEYIQDRALDGAGWAILAGRSTRPIVSSAAGTNASIQEKKEQLEWDAKSEKLAGAIRRTLDAGARTVIADLEPDDAVGMWNKLISHYEKKDPGNRFLAYQKLLAIRRGEPGHEDENMSQFATRVVAAASAV